MRNNIYTETQRNIFYLFSEIWPPSTKRPKTTTEFAHKTPFPRRGPFVSEDVITPAYRPIPKNNKIGNINYTSLLMIQYTGSYSVKEYFNVVSELYEKTVLIQLILSQQNIVAVITL